ncbi:hypothetical protein [Caulobacter sp. 17J80-11]|uniref:hypothetical protein n=1 Tax=Caulobacter sp. 17J80-11 TaxID=2763502 RepID=UPI001653B616|nr:hypothetical protein [Caulobacter sp. 17J80-11]MBC6981587.1 hypothetical protein [Caulobacter sp. 17J80-11]
MGTLYADCANAPDPARCLLERAAPAVDGREELLETAIVGLGAPELARLVELSDARDRASVLLAATLVRDPDPLADAAVRAAMAAAGDDAEVIRGAISTVDLRTGGLAPRPAGLLAVLAAAEAHARDDAWGLIWLGEAALNRGYPEAGLALLRRVAARGDAGPDVRAHAAERLLWRGGVDEAHRLMPADGDLRLAARIAAARLARGADPAAVGAVVRWLEHDLAQTSAAHVVWAEELTKFLRVLAAAGAEADVRCLAELYLERSRAPLPHEGPETRGDWAGLASDAFRLAGDFDAADAAAREGLQYLERLVAKWTRRIEAGDPDAEHHLRFLRVAPARALYRAGRVDEALATGRIRAMDRWRDATETGVETPDIGWVIAERDLAGLDEIKHRLIEAGDRAGAGELYEALTAARDGFDEPEVFRERELGLFAAAAGRGVAMRAHFARAAAALDSETDPEAAALAALQLACDWRRGEVLVG